MRRFCDILLTLLIALLILLLTGTQFAQADEADAPEVVLITIAATPTATPIPTPAPTPKPKLVYTEYDWPQSTIDALASVLWAECNTYEEKLAITALICNRWTYSSPFGADIESVIAQPGEFNTGRISDRNRDLARTYLNVWLTQYYGTNMGINVPRSAIYRDRVNGVLTFYDTNWSIVWEVK